MQQKGFEIINLGTDSNESCDYPDFAHELARQVEQNPASFGILICGTGIGMSMAANRHAHIRAALCTTPEMAKLAREHNSANVLCLGARIVSEPVAIEIADAFFSTLSSGENRHQRRVKKIEADAFS